MGVVRVAPGADSRGFPARTVLVRMQTTSLAAPSKRRVVVWPLLLHRRQVWRKPLTLSRPAAAGRRGGGTQGRLLEGAPL
jgi:hypothetical protein